MCVSLNPPRSHPNTFKGEKRTLIWPYHHAHARARAHTHSRRSLRPSFVPVRGFRAHHHLTDNTQNSVRFCLFAVLKFVLSAGQQVSLPFPLSLQQLLICYYNSRPHYCSVLTAEAVKIFMSYVILTAVNTVLCDWKCKLFSFKAYK